MIFLLAHIFSLTFFDKNTYSTFHPEIVRVVDATDHLLLRGNIPRDPSGNFCIFDLLQSIPALPPYDFTIFSLLTFEREDEAAFIEKLQEFEWDHSQHWIWRQVRAHFKDPRPTDTSLLTGQTFEGKFLRFPELVDQVFTLMHTPFSQRRVIYFHCRHGCNRSSALAAAYLMRCGVPFEEAWKREVETYPIYEPHELANFLSLYEKLLKERRTSFTNN